MIFAHAAKALPFDLLSTRQASYATGVPINVILTAYRTGELPYMRLDDRTKVRLSDVRAWQRSRRSAR